MNEIANEPMRKMNVFTRSWLLTKSAWQVLRADKELLIIDLLSFIAAVVILGLSSLFVFTELVVSTTPATKNISAGIPFDLVATALFVICFILITICNTLVEGAMVHAILTRLNGGDPTIRSSFSAIKPKLKRLVIFSFFVGIVGLVVQYLSERLPLAGKVMAWLGGAVFNVATFFVLPIIMTDGTDASPVKATRQSVAIIKQTWGESLALNVGIGLVAGSSIVVYLLTASVATLVVAMQSPAAGIATGALASLGLIALALVFSTLAVIVKTTVYYWATTGKEPVAFSKDVLRQTFTPKKARKLFV
jgi:Family of unknown function (DUF6159)